MNKDISYCTNNDCKRKYKCYLHKDDKDFNGQEFWFTYYDSDNCPNKEENNDRKSESY